MCVCVCVCDRRKIEGECELGGRVIRRDIR